MYRFIIALVATLTLFFGGVVHGISTLLMDYYTLLRPFMDDAHTGFLQGLVELAPLNMFSMASSAITLGYGLAIMVMFYLTMLMVLTLAYLDTLIAYGLRTIPVRRS